jgi:hypothetical protein
MPSLESHCAAGRGCRGILDQSALPSTHMYSVCIPLLNNILQGIVESAYTVLFSRAQILP